MFKNADVCFTTQSILYREIFLQVNNFSINPCQVLKVILAIFNFIYVLTLAKLSYTMDCFCNGKIVMALVSNCCNSVKMATELILSLCRDQRESSCRSCSTFTTCADAAQSF